MAASRAADLVVEHEPSRRDRTQRRFRRTRWCHHIPDAQPSAHASTLQCGQGAELGPQFVGSGVDEAVQLVRGCGACFHRAGLATRNCRTDSIGPSAVFGMTVASPLTTARAAASASTVSVLPVRRRV
jgi:hypothetical protein